MRQTSDPPEIDAPPPEIVDEKALFEHSNPWAQKASRLYHDEDYRQDNDSLFLASMAIAFELNKIRKGRSE